VEAGALHPQLGILGPQRARPFQHLVGSVSFVSLWRTVVVRPLVGLGAHTGRKACHAALISDPGA